MWFLILVSLATTAMAADVAPTDPDCTIMVGANRNIASGGIACTDKMAPATCGLVFGGPAPGNNPGLTAKDVHREPKCHTTSDLKKLAIEQCPKFCGFCCKTPEYNCLDKPYAQSGLNCATLSNRCTDATWKPILAQYCPATCGLCLVGGCVDKAQGCESSICYNVNFQEFAKENCACTCGKC